MNELENSILERILTEVKYYDKDYEKMSLDGYYFCEDWEEFIIEYYEKPSDIDEQSGVWGYNLKDAVFFVSGACNREDAVLQVKSKLDNSEDIE